MLTHGKSSARLHNIGIRTRRLIDFIKISTHIVLDTYRCNSLRVHSRAITTVSRVVHGGVGRVLDRRHVYAGSGGRIGTVVLVLEIVHLDRVIRRTGGVRRTSGVRRSIVAEIIRPIVIPDRVWRIVKTRRLVERRGGPVGAPLAVRRPVGPYAPVNVHVVIHVRLLVPEIYGKRWAT